MVCILLSCINKRAFEFFYDEKKLLGVLVDLPTTGNKRTTLRKSSTLGTMHLFPFIDGKEKFKLAYRRSITSYDKRKIESRIKENEIPMILLKIL